MPQHDDDQSHGADKRGTSQQVCFTHTDSPLASPLRHSFVKWTTPFYVPVLPLSSKHFSFPRPLRVDSRKCGIVAADLSRLTLKQANGTAPPEVGCYGFLNQL